MAVADSTWSRVLAAVFGGLAFLANRERRTADGTSGESMLSAFDAYAGQLAPALAGHWG